jgi:lipopolysaccharide/colanic/teichoic acid biosynthesis glycosyltransferase
MEAVRMSLVFLRPQPSIRSALRQGLSANGTKEASGYPLGQLALFVPASSSSWPVSSKRVVERILIAILLALALPFLAVLALVIRCTSRGPAIYPQTRLGWRDRPFTLYKLRTMEHDCERLTGPCWAIPNDPRVTLVGRFLRTTHMDELPQLWNVIRGEMSLIGPRPERPEIIVKLENAIPRYAERRHVLPGLTGLAQLQLPPDTDLSCVRRKLVYDLHYIETASFWLDCRILAGTVFKVLGLSCHVLPPIAMVANFDDTEVKLPMSFSQLARESLPTVRLATVPVRKR